MARWRWVREILSGLPTPPLRHKQWRAIFIRPEIPPRFRSVGPRRPGTCSRAEAQACKGSRTAIGRHLPIARDQTYRASSAQDRSRGPWRPCERSSVPLRESRSFRSGGFLQSQRSDVWRLMSFPDIRPSPWGDPSAETARCRRSRRDRNHRQHCVRADSPDR